MEGPLHAAIAPSPAGKALHMYHSCNPMLHSYNPMLHPYNPAPCSTATMAETWHTSKRVLIDSAESVLPGRKSCICR